MILRKSKIGSHEPTTVWLNSDIKESWLFYTASARS
jgi:hypothetical protein